MKVLLDNLFFLGQVASLAGLAWGAGLALRESTAWPARTTVGVGAALAASLLVPLRRVIRI